MDQKIAQPFVFSKFKLILQLSLATFSRAFPTSPSLLLNSWWFIVGMFIVDSKLFRCVFPMPACRDPNTALVLISLTRGPRLPALCSPEDFTSFRWPHKLHLTPKILPRPLCFSSVMFTRDNGPVGAINDLVTHMYLCPCMQESKYNVVNYIFSPAQASTCTLLVTSLFCWHIVDNVMILEGVFSFMSMDISGHIISNKRRDENIQISHDLQWEKKATN